MSNPDQKWFVFTGVQQEGPLSLDDLRERIAAGRFLGSHLAWCEGMPTWLKGDEIEQLRLLLHPPAPPPPIPPPIPQGFGPPPVPLAMPPQPAPLGPAPQAVFHPQAPQPAFQAQPVYQPQPAPPQPAQPQIRESAVANLLHEQLRHARSDDDEPETDLTPHGLLAEDDEPTTNSINPPTGHHPLIVAEPEDDPPKEELSALIYMNADAMEEKTGAIDARSLRKARKEATQATRIAEKSSRDFEKKVERHERKGRRWFSAGTLLLLGGAIGTGLGYGYQWVLMNQHWFRSLPETPGVRAEERTELQNVIGTSLGDSVRLAIAMSQVGTQAPSFYVVSNLPDGAVVDVYVHGEADSLLGASKFDSVLHVKLNEGVNRTDFLRGNDGSPPPPGRYSVVAVEGDPVAQPEAVRTVLSDAPRKATQLPPWVPADRKIAAARTYQILMAKTQAEYDTEIKALREQRNKSWLERFKTMGDVHDRLSAALSALHEALSISKAGNGAALAQARKRWDAANAETSARIEELSRQAADAQAADQISLMTPLRAGHKALGQAYALAAPAKQPEGFEKNLTDAAAQLAEFKTRLDQAREAIDKLSAPAPGPGAKEDGR